MPNKQIIVTQDDYGVSIEMQFMSDKKSVQDISGCTVELTIVCPDGTKIDEQAQITDEINGYAEFVLTPEYTKQTGLHRVYAEVVDSSSNVTAQEEIYYYVKPKHGGVN